MNGESDLHDTIRTVVKRADTLARLARGPAGKRDLRDDLGVSRSTVYKAVRELEEQGLVEQTGDQVRLTLVGRLLYEQYRSFVEPVGAVRAHEALLTVLPSEAPVTAELLVDADSVLADRPAPSEPIDVVEDVIRSADSAVGLAPVALQRFDDLFVEQRRAGDLTFDMVLEREVVDYLSEDDPEEFETFLSTDGFRYWETTEPLPFGLVVTEGEPAVVAVVVYDDEGRPVGTIRNDTPAAVDWGWDVFESYRESATRLGAESA